MQTFLFILAAIFFLTSCSSPEQDHPKVKNIILMIGDGMGTDQIYAAYTVNKGKLNLEKSTYVGFSKTYSADRYITDSGAGATAIATGVKTNNYSVGVDTLGSPLTTILELAEINGLATGLVATCRITDATPAAFVAHQRSRYENLLIAKDFVHSGIDIFIGGGRAYFENCDSTVSVSNALRKNGYTIVYNLDDINLNDPNNIGCLVADTNLPKVMDGRGNYLAQATRIALSRLSKNKHGFFIMIEGSQIDWGGHANDINYVVSEMLDFDEAIGEAFRFTDKNPGTLVIITADHETGGLSIVGGDIKTGQIDTRFNSTDHTAVMVPVFTYGSCAEEFAGIYENTAIFTKMVKLLGFTK
jgi:alkaline phosphatase